MCRRTYWESWYLNFQTVIKYTEDTEWQVSHLSRDNLHLIKSKHICDLWVMIFATILEYTFLVGSTSSTGIIQYFIRVISDVLWETHDSFRCKLFCISRYIFSYLHECQFYFEKWSLSFKFVHVTDLFFTSISSKEEILNLSMIKK